MAISTSVRLGIDVGATGIKGALVDVDAGILVSERVRILTPKPATPESVASVVSEIVRTLEYSGPIGIGFPSIVKDARCMTATNIDSSFVGIHLEELFGSATGHPCRVLNDADVAALAELEFLSPQERNGTVLVVTLGTGIGSGLLYKSQLIPNIEIGRIPWKKGEVENYLSSASRKSLGTSWKDYGQQLGKFVNLLAVLFSPDLILFGGGISKKLDQFSPYMKTNVKFRAAHNYNHAGILGAAQLVK